MLEVFIASLGYAGCVIFDKIILDKLRVPVLRFIPLTFIWLAVITAIFLPKWGAVDWSGALDPTYLALFAGMILVAVMWNIHYYNGIQKENLAEFELIMLFSPLATTIFAAIFLPAERDLSVMGAGVVASSALIATRFRKHHMVLSKVAKRSLLAMALMSFEAILIKELLSVYSPVALYFVRTTVIALVFLILYRPKLFSMSKEAYALTIVSAMFAVVQMVLKFYGFASLGVIETTMVLLLGPFMVYGFSYFYFQERLYKRDIAAVAVIVLSILYVEFWR